MVPRSAAASLPSVITWIAAACALGVCGSGGRLEPARASSTPAGAPAPLTSSGPAATLGTTGSPPAVIVAVIRNDGILLPYAAFSGGTWDSPGPGWRHTGDEDDTSGPDDPGKSWFEMIGRTITTWHAAASAGRSETLHVSGAVRIQVDCTDNWGLRTDRKPVGKKSEAGWPAGIALSGDAAAVAMRDVAGDAGEARAFLELIRAPFDESEAAAKVAPAQQASIKLTGLYRSLGTVDGRAIYFVEAERDYTVTSPGGVCGPVTRFQAWMTRQGDAWRWLDRIVYLTDCDGKEANDVTPLGILSLDGRTYVFAVENGYEDTRYSVLEVGASAIGHLLTIGEGGC